MTAAIPALLLAAALQQPPQPDQIRIEPAELRVEVDAARTLDAVALDGEGKRIEEARIRWFLVEGNAIRIRSDGTVTGVRPGRARVAAVSGPAAAFAVVTVSDLPAAEISARLTEPTLPAGTSAPLRVRAANRLGQVLESPALRFTSQDTSVAGVDATGRVFARAPGRTRIRVSSDGADVTIPVRVVSSEGLSFELTPGGAEVRTGDVVRFRVEARRSGEPGRAVRPAWSVGGEGARIAVEETDGIFVAEEPGRYRVTARIGEVRARTAIVEVAPREHESALIQVGRGGISSHHSGDTWVFEGDDGRDYAYVGTFMHDWMTVFDVTDPARTIRTDSLRVDARRINDVKIHPNGRLGVITREGASDRQNGIVFLDLTDPAHPTVLSEYRETLTGGVHNVWIDGEDELIYAAHNGTMDLHILDISDPTAAREVGRWGLDKRTKTLHDVIVQDDYAYLSYWDDGLVILDVGAGSHGGTPTEPAFVSRISYPEGHTHVAWRHGDYAFVGDEIFPANWSADRPIEARGFIHVIDVSDLENPRQVAHYEVPEAGAHNVWAEGDRLYVGYYQAGLRVVDISGELRGDLYAQGREIARFRPVDGQMVVPNWPMTWGAQPFKGNIFSSDLNSGLWITRLEEPGRTVF